MEIKDLPLLALQRAASPGPGEQPWLLLLMHGVGSNEKDLFGLAPYVPPRFHVLSLRAPYAMPMAGPDSHGWFAFSVDAQGRRHIDEAQARQARALLLTTLQEAQTRLGVGPARSVLGGFSQGGIMALTTLLTQPALARAAMVWHGRLLPEALHEQAAQAQFTGKSLWVSHGVDDNVIPLSSAQAIRTHVQELPLELSYHEYPGYHELRPEELAASMQWLQALE